MNKLHAKLASSKLKHHEGYDKGGKEHNAYKDEIVKHNYSLSLFMFCIKAYTIKAKQKARKIMPRQTMANLNLLNVSTLIKQYAISVKNAVKMMLSTFLRMVMSASSFFIGSLYPSKLNLI